MTYDILIKNGTIVDGSGMPSYRADLGVKDGKIARIGRLNGAIARETIDADGKIVSPGFVDGHTHMDAQINWDFKGTCSCYFGVTSVVMGNCGFTIAPCKLDEIELVTWNLERAEDIPAAAMESGIEWSWETFGQYLDAIDKLPKGLNYAGYVGHSALRTYAMGRNYRNTASSDQIEVMAKELRSALRAGALGMSTTRDAIRHVTPDGSPVASAYAAWEEVEYLTKVMADEGAGFLEITPEGGALTVPERGEFEDFYARLTKLCVETGVPTTMGALSSLRNPWFHERQLAVFDNINKSGGTIWGQVTSRPIGIYFSFETKLLYDDLPVWRELRAKPLPEQEELMRDPEMRRKLVEAVVDDNPADFLGMPVSYEGITVVQGGFQSRNDPSVAQLAFQRGVRPVEVIIDTALEKGLKRFFYYPLTNNLDSGTTELLKSPYTVTCFTDSGAHILQVLDVVLPVDLLSYWAREAKVLSLEQAVRMLSFLPATRWGFHDRGLLREGFAADINVFDWERLGLDNLEVRADLPADCKRLFVKAVGFDATLVNGQIAVRNGEHTGAYAGKLIRGPLARH